MLVFVVNLSAGTRGSIMLVRHASVITKAWQQAVRLVPCCVRASGTLMWRTAAPLDCRTAGLGSRLAGRYKPQVLLLRLGMRLPGVRGSAPPLNMRRTRGHATALSGPSPCKHEGDQRPTVAEDEYKMSQIQQRAQPQAAQQQGGAQGPGPGPQGGSSLQGEGTGPSVNTGNYKS